MCFLLILWTVICVCWTEMAWWEYCVEKYLLLHPLPWWCSQEIVNEVWWKGHWRQSTSYKLGVFGSISQLNTDIVTKEAHGLSDMYDSPRQTEIHHLIIHVMSQSNRDDRSFVNNDGRCYIVFPIYGMTKTVCSWVMAEFNQSVAWPVQRIIHCSDWICKHVLMFISITAGDSLIEAAFQNDMFNFCLQYRFYL